MNKLNLKSIFVIGVFMFFSAVLTSQAQTTPKYTQDLYFGIKSSSVSTLQSDLSTDSAIYPEKLVTGYFGSLTQKAIQRFQVKYGIVNSGTPSTTGYGRVGPKTRAKLNEIYGQSVSSKEDIGSCVTASNYTYEFYVVFGADVSKETAEQILRDNSAETFHLTSEPPSGYSFELPNDNMCTSLEGVFKVKDTFKIPALYRQPEANQPTSGPVNSLSCQNVPSYFVTPNGYISSPSNNFILTYYQNGDQLKNELEKLGGYNVVPIGEKTKTYYTTFQNGKICKSVGALKQHPNVKSIGTVPYLPGPTQ